MPKVLLTDDVEVIPGEWTLDGAIPIRNRKFVVINLHAPTTDEWPDIPSRFPLHQAERFVLKKDDAMRLTVAL